MIRSKGACFALLGSIVLSASACGGFAPKLGSSTARSQLALGARRNAYVYRTLVQLHGPNGSDPVAAPTVVGTTLYGLTYSGGAYNDGIFYSLSTSGQLGIIHSFGLRTDGAQPFGGIIEQNGTFYGTTTRGGKPNHGTIFSVTTAGKERGI